MKIEITESNASRYFRTAARAEKLIAEGYKFHPFINDAGAYSVETPSGAWYFTYTQGPGADFRPHCSCPDFENPAHRDFCKHLIGAAELDAKDEAEMWNSICELAELAA